jgi:hypothetical protein
LYAAHPRQGLWADQRLSSSARWTKLYNAFSVRVLWVEGETALLSAPLTVRASVHKDVSVETLNDERNWLMCSIGKPADPWARKAWQKQQILQRPTSTFWKQNFRVQTVTSNYLWWINADSPRSADTFERFLQHNARSEREIEMECENSRHEKWKRIIDSTKLCGYMKPQYWL